MDNALILVKGLFALKTVLVLEGSVFVSLMKIVIQVSFVPKGHARRHYREVTFCPASNSIPSRAIECQPIMHSCSSIQTQYFNDNIFDYNVFVFRGNSWQLTKFCCKMLEAFHCFFIHNFLSTKLSCEIYIQSKHSIYHNTKIILSKMEFR